MNGAEDPISGLVRGTGRSARLGELRENRLEAEAHHYLSALGTAKSPACWAPPNSLKQHCRRIESARRRLHQFRHQRPRLSSASEARTRWKNSSTMSRATLPIPKPNSPSGSARSCGKLPTDDISGSAAGSAFARGFAHRRARFRLRLRRISAARWNRRARISASAAKTAAVSIIRSTMISTGTRISATPISCTAARSRKPPAPTSCVSPMPICCPFEFGNFADTMQTIVKELKDARHRNPRRNRRTQSRDRRRRVPRRPTDPRSRSSPPAETVPPFLNFAPLDNAADASTRSAAEYRKRSSKRIANGGTASLPPRCRSQQV